MGRLDDAIADLRAAIEKDGDAILARAQLVDLLVEKKNYADAVPQVEAMLAFWQAPHEDLAAEIERRRAETFARGLRDMLDALPRHVRRRIDENDLRAVVERVRSSTFSAPNCLTHPESAPDAFACAVKLIRLQHAAGDEQGLAAAVAQARALAGNLARRASLGQVLFQEECKDAAREVLLGLRDELTALRTDPLQVYFWQRYVSAVRSVADELGDVLAADGDVLGACRILRELGSSQKAELLMQRSGNREALVAQLQAKIDTTRAALEAARAKAGGDLRSAELDYRDALIELADVHVGAKAYDEAEAVYRKSLDLLPDDIDIREVVAKLAERRGDAAAAIAMHKDIVDVKRRRRRTSGGDDPVPPTRLRPMMPDESGNGNNVYYGSGTFYSGSYYPGGTTPAATTAAIATRTTSRRATRRSCGSRRPATTPTACSRRSGGSSPRIRRRSGRCPGTSSTR